MELLIVCTGDVWHLRQQQLPRRTCMCPEAFSFYRCGVFTGVGIHVGVVICQV